jgi:hypothetical protein
MSLTLPRDMRFKPGKFVSKTGASSISSPRIGRMFRRDDGHLIDEKVLEFRLPGLKSPAGMTQLAIQ